MLTDAKGLAMVDWPSSSLVHQMRNKLQLGVIRAGQCKIKTDTIERFNSLQNKIDLCHMTLP